MIVVDTNVIAALLLAGEHARSAEALRRFDGDWIAPLLWRSEFRNVLSHYVRRGGLSLEEAQEVMEDAEALMRNSEYPVASRAVLDLAARSGCTAYDCEFVALAIASKTRLVTLDKQVLDCFPSSAVHLDAAR
ncbi:MAG: type II toxin-antitoxin system VapC family toxin [Acidobacteria bacterium]|nr:type II toxin-antitoxin system VapC family toxin [Acidobacteriota bacterium]